MPDNDQDIEAIVTEYERKVADLTAAYAERLRVLLEQQRRADTARPDPAAPRVTPRTGQD